MCVPLCVYNSHLLTFIDQLLSIKSTPIALLLDSLKLCAKQLQFHKDILARYATS